MEGNGDSEHLRDLEAHAEEHSSVHEDLPADDAGEADEANAEEGPPEEKGPEQMHPPGEDPEAADSGEELKRIDEDVTGDEETEDIADVEAGDG